MSYHQLRNITIFTQSIVLPTTTLVGFELGSRRYRLALSILVGQVILVAIQSYIWWRAMEVING